MITHPGPAAQTRPKTSNRQEKAAITAVAATYIYFLLWAQFGFLHLLQERTDAAGVQLAMASMGVVGLLASLATGALHRRLSGCTWMSFGFAMSAGAALMAFAAHDPTQLAIAAAGIGVGAAVLTVSLAVHLSTLVERRSLGMAIGLGTGLAYLVCNIPPLFAGSAFLQACAVLIACLAGLAAIQAAARPSSSFPASSFSAEFSSTGHTTSSRAALLSLVGAVASFLVLIWLDSAAFAIIQENLSLRAHTWGGPTRQLLLGSTHLVAAILAGWLLDRGSFRSLLIAAFGLFTLAFTVLQHQPSFADITGPIYAIGISLYSVALVYWAATSTGPVSRPWRAALVFGLGGWLGSALGVGMAQDLERIPTAFIWATGAVLVISGWLDQLGTPDGRRWWRALITSHGMTFAAALLASIFYLAGPVFFSPGDPQKRSATSDVSRQASIDRGQRIYIREGCIHCHSQYIRPGTRDEVLYGAPTALNREAGPVMIGTRRQGPDLSQVGDRRDADWLADHLRDPRDHLPGSRMPSYARLFTDDVAGDDLVAYLRSLANRTEALDQYGQLDHGENGGGENGGGESGG